MCTVTFIPRSTNNFILTSNRDESPNRNTLPPEAYEIDGVRLLFPKDELAGGTWIGASDQNRLICLLNGGFEPHEPENNYRMSRGVIVTDLLTKQDAEAAINDYDFTNIEPFTIILVDWNDELRLFELIWDGNDSHFKENMLAPHIWSSSLLYPSEIKRKREAWFTSFLLNNISPDPNELLNFHKTAGDGNAKTNLVMDRGFVKTKSISQFSKNDNNTFIRYEDLQTNQISNATL